jgi:hypothetical protein
MGRKLIIPDNRHKCNSFDVTIVPTLDALVSDAMSIIGTELSFYRAKTKRGARLDLKEAKVIRDYVEALVKLSKEAREASRHQDLTEMTNEELLQLAMKLISKDKGEEIVESRNVEDSVSKNVEGSAANNSRQSSDMHDMQSDDILTTIIDE